MLTAYGHAAIHFNNVDYVISPTFANVAKLGTPKEIIDTFKNFIESSIDVYKFMKALTILECFLDKKLPDEYTGVVRFNKAETKLLWVVPAHGRNTFKDVIILAEHCLIHSICGKVKISNESDGQESNEFNPYDFMELARIHLGLNASEAEKMTMSEFTRLMESKYPNEEKKEQDKIRRSRQQDSAMIEYFNKKNGLKNG